MKQIITLAVALGFLILSCEIEKESPQADFDTTLSTQKSNVTSKKFMIIDADRCEQNIDVANLWWPGDDPSENFDASFFESPEKGALTFIEYSDGTAHVAGTTVAVLGQDCKVTVDLWLKNKTTWADWSASGGEFKSEGCSEAVAENQSYYLVDAMRSSITSSGSDCLGEGTFGLEQRPDPSDSSTPNFGVVVGPGGALWDTNVGEIGLAGWAWITNKNTGERLWISDFNFLLGEEIKVVKKCAVVNADRCTEVAPDANFWWPGDDPSVNFEESFFASAGSSELIYREYEDGTVNISGTTNAVLDRDCEVTVNLWLKDKKNWTEWSTAGGEFKAEGCSEATAENQMYYVIDTERSCITSAGSDCLGEGTYGLEQRPDPNDPATPSFGVVVGPGAALWDTNVGAQGLAGWAWIIDKNTGERLWISDFNFLIDCTINKREPESRYN